MKRFLKWFLGITLTLALVFIVASYMMFGRVAGFGSVPSGGELSSLQSQYDVVFYDINLEVTSETESIAGYTIVQVRAMSPKLATLELDLLDNFEISAVQANGKTQAFERTEKHKFAIQLDPPLAQNELRSIRIDYAGKPPVAVSPPWLGGFNWSTDTNGDDWIGLSCQGDGAKVWFPCKDHPSDEPDSAAINITVPKPYVVASNGVLRGISDAREGFHTYHWFTGYPTNNYGLNISIAKYEILERTYVGEDGTTMPVQFYVLPESREGADAHIDMAVDMLTVLRQFFGEYPFIREKFAIVETDYLGMEHQTINAYGNKYRYGKIGDHEYDWLMLHELGHEWWGNKVTVNDWRDFWIHEGICSYGEALYHLAKGGDAAYKTKMASLHRRVSNSRPILAKKNATTSDAYNGDIYAKGAYFMHTLRFVLGDKDFFPILKEFSTDSAYTYQNRVATEHFIELIQKRTGNDLSKLFHLYLETTDVPEVEVVSTGEKEYQIRMANLDFDLPMEVKLGDGSIQVFDVGPNAKTIASDSEPVIDPNRWYYGIEN